MNPLLQKMMARYMAPAGEESGAGGAATVDRGDTLAAGAPKVDEAAAAAAAAAEADAAAEAERIRAEEAAKAGGKEEGKEEGKDDDAASKDGKPAMIPVKRHKEVLDRTRAERDALAAQLAQYQKGQEVVQTNTKITEIEEKVSTKEAEYNVAMVAGETEKATTLMREIRAMEREMGDLKADMKAQASTAMAIEQVRYDAVVDRLEAAYPALNPQDENFDKEKVADVMDLKETYERKGMPAYAALQKAVEKLMPAATAKQETATTVKPRVDETDVARADRKADATAKAVDAASKTPPLTDKVGVDGDKLGGGAVTAEDVMKMGQDKFSKLNEETLARLRGDTV